MHHQAIMFELKFLESIGSGSFVRVFLVSCADDHRRWPAVSQSDADAAQVGSQRFGLGRSNRPSRSRRLLTGKDEPPIGDRVRAKPVERAQPEQDRGDLT